MTHGAPRSDFEIFFLFFSAGHFYEDMYLCAHYGGSITLMGHPTKSYKLYLTYDGVQQQRVCLFSAVSDPILFSTVFVWQTRMGSIVSLYTQRQT